MQPDGHEQVRRRHQRGRVRAVSCSAGHALTSHCPRPLTFLHLSLARVYNGIPEFDACNVTTTESTGKYAPPPSPSTPLPPANPHAACTASVFAGLTETGTIKLNVTGIWHNVSYCASHFPLCSGADCSVRRPMDPVRLLPQFAFLRPPIRLAAWRAPTGRLSGCTARLRRRACWDALQPWTVRFPYKLIAHSTPLQCAFTPSPFEGELIQVLGLAETLSNVPVFYDVRTSSSWAGGRLPPYPLVRLLCQPPSRLTFVCVSSASST